MVPTSVFLISTLMIVFFSAIIGGLVARRFKLPMLVGYIVSGIVFGNALPLFIDKAFLQVIADIGVTLLLFTLGVEFSLHRVKRVVGTVSWTAIVQILLSIFIFLIVLLGLGFSFLVALFLAIAGSLSSTAVIVKLLSEKDELDTHVGEIITTWLVIQDIAVIPLVMLLASLVTVTSSNTPTLIQTFTVVAGNIVKASIILIVLYSFGRKVIPWVLNSVVRLGNREIFLLTTVALVFLAATTSIALGISAAIGAFIAGLLMAQTSQQHAIFAEIRPLRDIFSVVFFVSLGLALPILPVIRLWSIILILSATILITKWGIVLGLSRFVGFHSKTGFYVAIALMQMSEFGFIIAREGARLGVLRDDSYIVLVAVTFLTIAVGTICFSSIHRLYDGMKSILPKQHSSKFFGDTLEKERSDTQAQLTNHIVICGYGRVGKYVGRALEMVGIPFVIIDYDHTTVTKAREKGLVVVYGDPGDSEILTHAHIESARAIVIAIGDRHTQELIVGNVQTSNKRIRIICRSHHEEDQRRLKALGVTTIVQPEFEAAVSVVERLLTDFGLSQQEITGKISRLKIEHGLG